MSLIFLLLTVLLYLQTGDRFDIHEKISKTKAVTTLVIRGVTIDDYGTYSCLAVSPAGNSSHDFKFMAGEFLLP